MDIIGAGQSEQSYHDVVRRLTRGEVGIIPTDTIYGLTGVARADVVTRIDAIKRRARPASVIAPSAVWVARHIAPRARPWFRVARHAIAAPATLLFPAGLVARRDLPAGLTASGYLGIRVADHFITTLASRVGQPLLSTSVNRTTRLPMQDFADLDEGIAGEVDFLVYEGEKHAPPSPLFIFDTGCATPRRIGR